jgi:hypothetical protein
MVNVTVMQKSTGWSAVHVQVQPFAHGGAASSRAAGALVDSAPWDSGSAGMQGAAEIVKSSAPMRMSKARCRPFTLPGTGFTCSY